MSGTGIHPGVAVAVPTGPNGGPLDDPWLTIGMNCFKGVGHVHSFGSKVEALANTTVDVWDGTGNYTFPTSSADITHIYQPIDQAALRGTTWALEGLDINFEPVEQTVVLDATDSSTPVALDTPLFRLNLVYMSSNAVMATPVFVSNAGQTVNYAEVQADHGQSLNAIYTVPAGYTGFITAIEADHIPVTNKDPRSVHYHVQTRRNGLSEGWRAMESFGTTTYTTAFNKTYVPYLHVMEKTDMRLTAHPFGEPVHVHAALDMVIVNNDVYRGLAEHVALMP